jgi:AraC family transcriptional regulator of adaptative response / DNA-3-methyladenine glycosylase II
VLTDDARYAALVARDSRFDGVFFVGVTTTGVYCRPVCPARTPAAARCEFFGSPALAERAGFRACFRCRPELAPGNAPVDAVDVLVARAARKIAEGELNERSIDELAGTLGVTSRHLRRATEARLGVSPVELAQSHRLALAKQLLHDTALPLTDIAFAAGFGSVRRFNAVFSDRMGMSPSEVRRGNLAARLPASVTAGSDTLALRLDYRAPYDWADVIGFLRGRAIPGVEQVTDDAYRRVVHLDRHVGEIEVRPAADRDALHLSVSTSLLPVLMPLVVRVRRMFDLDAHPGAIAAVLGRDKQLAPLVRKRPGLRVPGAIDPFEASIRALLGQQVSVAAATTLAGRFAQRFGAPYAPASPAGGPLAFRFPTAAEVVAAGIDAIAKVGLPGKRAAAIHNFARVVDAGEVVLDAACELDAFVAQLVELPGIGPWTANYLAMRALHVPDAFPAADLGVQKALGRTGARAAETRAEAWRPYRAYAVLHLWFSLGDNP